MLHETLSPKEVRVPANKEHFYFYFLVTIHWPQSLNIILIKMSVFKLSPG